jgi:hypothetical protein
MSTPPESDLEHALTQLLQRRADDVQPLPDLGPRVIRRGRTARRRRRIATVGTGALALAAGIAVVSGMLPGLSGQAGPATPSPVPTGTSTTEGLAPTGPYLASLPTGRPLKTLLRAELVGGQVRLTSEYGKVTLPGKVQLIAYPVRTAAGILFSAQADPPQMNHPGGPQQLYLLQPGGRLTLVHTGLFSQAALSPDGTRFAVSEVTTAKQIPSRVVVRSLSGTVQASLDLQPGTDLAGWTVSGILLHWDPYQAINAGASPTVGAGTPVPLPTTGDSPLTESRYSWWVPGSAAGPTLPYRTVVAVPGQPGIVVVREQPAGGAGSCWRMLTLSTGALGPEVDCGSVDPTGDVGPDARHLLRNHEGYDLVAGTSKHLLGGMQSGFMFWEDATHVVTTLNIGSWVRCDLVSGRCEIAPEPAGAGGEPVIITWAPSDSRYGGASQDPTVGVATPSGAPTTGQTGG